MVAGSGTFGVGGGVAVVSAGPMRGHSVAQGRLGRQESPPMRIAVDYRILAVGAAQMTRGMPRFTQQQLRSVLALDPDNEYLLLTRAGDDLSLIGPQIRA